MLMGLLLRQGCTLADGVVGRSLKIEILSTSPPGLDALFTSQTTVTFASHSPISHPSTTTISTPTHSSASYPPGLKKAYESLLEVATYPLVHSGLVARLGIECLKGVLLHGPPGVGKTLLVSTVARACGAKMLTIHGPEIYGAYYGESERRLREKFGEARDMAEREDCPCILFIDELDALTPHRTTTSAHESRVVAQLLTLMDGITSRGRLVVVAATNRPNAIDPALRRPGRFDREVAIGVPSEAERLGILQGLVGGVRLEGVTLEEVARVTNGFVGADLAALWREAVGCAVSRTKGDFESPPTITATDMAHALHTTQPSTSRSLSTPSTTTYANIGGLHAVKLRLRQTIEWPLLHRATFARLGLEASRGVLLYGPPGCSKTTLVKALAATQGVTFLSVDGAGLYSSFVGEAEREVRTQFARARATHPSILFIDEVDAIVGKRALGSNTSKGDSVQERVLSALLNEMDGIESAKGVVVVGATNRPDLIDAALLRPGRFDRILYVPPPDLTTRKEILQVHTRGMPLSPRIDLEDLARRTERYTGADLKGVCREAGMEGVRSRGDVVEPEHFDVALAAIPPTLSEEMLKQYEVFERRFGSGVA
ncbi:hypothetical protein HK104_000276 [Borealophlyctis nickersoniae]|nr:hypothetical protein HK104_000276 [Borealophlyctis nickersoniae]